MQQFCTRVFGNLNAYQMYMWEEHADLDNDVLGEVQEATDAIRAVNTTQTQRDRHTEAVNPVHIRGNKAMLVQLIWEI